MSMPTICNKKFIITTFTLDECPEDSCSSVPCQNGGICLPPEAELAEFPLRQMTLQSVEQPNPGSSPSGVCQCPLGFAGQFCQHSVDVQVWCSEKLNRNKFDRFCKFRNKFENVVNFRTEFKSFYQF